MADEKEPTKEEMATELANLENVGKLYDEARKLNADKVASLRAKLGLPPENGGGGTGGGPPTTLEAFQKLSPAERTQFYRDHPEQYSKFMEQIRTKSERDLFNKGVAPL